MATQSIINTTNLFEAIKKYDSKQIAEELKTIDINYSDCGITPLWVGITGDDRIRNKRTGRGNYDTVNFLLEQGADPNKNCVTVPPVYIATVEEDWGYLSLLLNYGASPNCYKIDQVVKITEDPPGYVCKCKLPLVYAIENSDAAAVEALLAFGAIFGKDTIARAKKMILIQKKAYRQSNNDNNALYIKYIDSKAIVETLENSYDENFQEEKVKEFVNKYDKCFKHNTHFVGLTPLEN